MAVFDTSFLNPAFRKTYSDQESGCVSSDQQAYELCRQTHLLKEQNNLLGSKKVNIDDSGSLKGQVNDLSSIVQGYISVTNSRLEGITRKEDALTVIGWLSLFLNFILGISLVYAFLRLRRSRTSVSVSD